jgi:hypothetical protein
MHFFWDHKKIMHLKRVCIYREKIISGHINLGLRKSVHLERDAFIEGAFIES